MGVPIYSKGGRVSQKEAERIVCDQGSGSWYMTFISGFSSWSFSP